MCKHIVQIAQIAYLHKNYILEFWGKILIRSLIKLECFMVGIVVGNGQGSAVFCSVSECGFLFATPVAKRTNCDP